MDSEPQVDNELAGTAMHEAGHGVILKLYGVRVLQVKVTSASSGLTSPDPSSIANLSDEQLANVLLAGMYAEGSVRTTYSTQIALSILNGASSDRRRLYKDLTGWWLTQGDLGQQVAYRRAEKLVEDNQEDIERVAEALLAKEGFPKTLNEDEFESALNPS